MRYPEESTTRENPLRIGTKHIKLNGVEYPFVAVSDHWRNSLLHDNRLVWIHHYAAIKGLRPSIFKVYYATVKVPYNRLPWTVDNACFGSGSSSHPAGVEFDSLETAIDVAMNLAKAREQMWKEMGKSYAAELGRKGGMVKSERKTMSSRENGKLGGRKRKQSAETVPDINLFSD